MLKESPNTVFRGSALQRDLNRIFSLPITLKTGHEISAEDLSRLSANFGAVFLALGATNQLKMGIQGEELDGVVCGLDFLTREDMQRRCRGARVVVIGGGNTAMDAARTAVRRDAETVTVLYRRNRDLMPAFPEEVEEAVDEGIRFQFSAAPVALIGDGNRIEAVRWVETRLVPADSLPLPVSTSEKTVLCDLVIVAVGQKVAGSSIPDELRMDKGRVRIDAAGRTSHPAVYAGGDLTPTRASVVDGMASGKLAAFFMHVSLVGRDAEGLPAGVILGEGAAFSIEACFHPAENSALDSVVQVDELDLVGIDRKPAVPAQVRSAGERVQDFHEAHASWPGEGARQEAERCFYCGTCIRCDCCWRYCPECSMLRPDEGDVKYRADSDYCKGCGICASECLRGVVEMREQP